MEQIQALSKPYSEALFDLAKKHNLLHQLEEELQAFFTLLQQQESIRIFFEAPHIPASEKIQVIQRTFQKTQASSLFLNFLKVLAQNRRFSLFPSILQQYKALLDKEEGRLHVKAITARKTEEDVIQKITQTVQQKTGKTVILDHKVQPDILGGMILQIEDTQINGSVRQRLDTWKKILMEKRYEI
ncbi:MAG: ATP synthase F1 subunit delta [Planctomycetota bacterium]|nr:MAG: ATP synthase F1 subunit delta [Planctomycetota bacterium]